MNNKTEDNLFESLSPEEQNKVFDFLQLVNFEDLNEAAALLKKHDFDLVVREDLRFYY